MVCVFGDHRFRDLTGEKIIEDNVRKRIRGFEIRPTLPGELRVAFKIQVHARQFRFSSARAAAGRPPNKNCNGTAIGVLG
jgi:hypothetical protein